MRSLEGVPIIAGDVSASGFQGLRSEGREVSSVKTLERWRDPLSFKPPPQNSDSGRAPLRRVRTF